MQGPDLNATIVSIVPFAIREQKPGLIPPYFDIPAAEEGDFEILVVGGAHFPVYLDQSRGSLRVPTPSGTLAHSIVDDYIRAQLARTPDAHPGIFWVPGTFTKKGIVEHHSDKLQESHECQMRWFARLIQLADDDWAQNHQHRSVSDIQRYAAKAMHLEREWLAPIRRELVTAGPECPACGTAIKGGIVLCPQCSYVLDPERHKMMKFGGQSILPPATPVKTEASTPTTK